MHLWISPKPEMPKVWLSDSPQRVEIDPQGICEENLMRLCHEKTFSCFRRHSFIDLVLVLPYFTSGLALFWTRFSCGRHISRPAQLCCNYRIFE